MSNYSNIKFRTQKIIQRLFNKNVVFGWITFLLSLFITIWFYSTLKKDSLAAAESYFTFRINELSEAIQQRMNAYEQVLSGGVGLFNASSDVTRKDWANYINRLHIDRHYPGILGLGFSQVIHPDELENHIKKVSADGFPDYRVWPEYERDEYTSIVYLEPFSGRNLRAFGYDMFTEETRRKAMAAARDSGITSVSSKVILVQETSTDVQTGFLMYLPVYDITKPIITVPQRREAIMGYVFSPFRTRDLMEGIFGAGLQNISLEIFDEDELTPENLMFISSKNPDKDYESRFLSVARINIDNHIWTLRFKTLPSFELLVDTQKPLIVIITGIIISILIFIVVISFVRTNEVRMDLELLLESSGEGIYGVDTEGRCTFINSAAMKMLDLSIEQCKDYRIHDLIHHHYPDMTIYPFEECPINYSLQEGKSFRSENEYFFRTDGSMFQVDYSFNPIIQNHQVTGGVVTFSDITEKMKIERALKSSEDKFRLAVNNFPYTFIIYDRDRRITFINNTGFKNYYLLPEKEIMGKRDEEILPEEITSCYLAHLISTVEQKIKTKTECTINMGGNRFSFIINFIPLLNDEGEIEQIVGITHDITELKKAQENIFNSLKEKDVLLKEIHHRVKNNLQIVSSLLNLQTNKLEDKTAIELLKESQNRVRSMALIHERLYQTVNMSEIDFSEYIPELLDHLLISYNKEENPVKIELDIQKTSFNIDISISLALIINELVSNTMKHAFTDRAKINEENKIVISLKDKGKYELIIKDNGKGFPEDINFQQTNSLGLQLVNSLVEQIDGTIELNVNEGTEFIILFPV